MYLRRLVTLLIVAAGTVALAHSITRYQPHFRSQPIAGPSSLVIRRPDGTESILKPEILTQLVRTQSAPPQVRGDAQTVQKILLQAVFPQGLTQTAAVGVTQGDVVILVVGIAIPNTKDQRLLTYASDDGIFILVDDFIRPASERVDGVRLEKGRLVYSFGGKDRYSHDFEVPQVQLVPQVPGKR